MSFLYRERKEVRRRREGGLFFLMKLELSETSKFSTIPVSPIMSKEIMKVEEIEKGDWGPPTRKVFFLRFCRTWTKRHLITSQTRVKRVSRIHHRTILRWLGTACFKSDKISKKKKLWMDFFVHSSFSKKQDIFFCPAAGYLSKNNVVDSCTVRLVNDVYAYIWPLSVAGNARSPQRWEFPGFCFPCMLFKGENGPQRHFVQEFCISAIGLLKLFELIHQVSE